MSPTTVVNIRHQKCQIYCGRGSFFGNPYDYEKLGITRDEACELFVPYFRKKLTDPDFCAKVMTLRGKVLGCWCVPKRCHVETIVEYLESI